MMGAPLYVIGLGPGDAALLPELAVRALERARTIVGYGLYVEMVPPALRAGKEILTTGMRREAQRCNAAIDAALAGSPTAVVCSGDSGVYGMSGLILELAAQRGLLEQVPVEVIPGIPAVCAAAALLGAPLMHDFACVSLSDLLTPWETILRRLEAALAADFVLALYNPRSRGRQEQLETALALALRHRPPQTPVGLVRNAYREGQQVRVCALNALRAADVDMLSLLIIGNASTRFLGNSMVTPRGYDLSRGGEKCEGREALGKH